MVVPVTIGTSSHMGVQEEPCRHKKKQYLYVAPPFRFRLPHSGNEAIEHVTFLPPAGGNCKEHPKVENGKHRLA